MEGFCGFDYGILFIVPITVLFILGFGLWGKKKKLPFILNLKNKGRLLFVLVTCTLIELIQLLIIVTVNPVDVIFDINDVICNCLGGLIGYGLILIFDKCMKKSEYGDSKKVFGILRNVCINCGKNKKSLDL